jgi:hypothetical protein
MADFLRGSAVPMAASGPSLDDQVDRLESLGLHLHPDCDRPTLARAVARGVTPDDLGEGGHGARPIPPHRRACYWWLLCEDVGCVPTLRRRLRIDLEEQVFATGHMDADDMPLVEQLGILRRMAHRLRGVAGLDVPRLEPVTDGPEECRARIDGVVVDWTNRGLRDRLRDALTARLPDGDSLVMYRDVVPEAPDLCVVVPSVHVTGVRELIAESLPPALLAGGAWLDSVEQHETSEQVSFTLDPTRMTSGLAVSSYEVPAWVGVHPPMALADQLERLRRVGLVPWTDDVAPQLPVRRPSRVPRMCDRPFHDLLATPSDVPHRGLLRGIVLLQELIPDRGGTAQIAVSLTHSIRAMAETAQPGLAIPRVRVLRLGPGKLEITALIDGRAVTAAVSCIGGRRPVWDATDLLARVSQELQLDAQCWMRLRPGSRTDPAVHALVPVWQADQVQEMARTAFGDEGLHLAASLQEELWYDWSDRTGSHDHMLTMTASSRLATLESCGIGVADPGDRELAEEAAESSTWGELLGTAHRGHRSVFAYACVWSAQEIADQGVEELPAVARKIAESVGRTDVELRLTGEEDGRCAVVLEVAGETVRLVEDLPPGEALCGMVQAIARHVTPPGRELVTLGARQLWPLASRAGQLRMLLSGG